MASALEKKQIDELLANYRAIAEREQKRIDELEQQRAHFAGEMSSSLTVPASAFVTSYVRAYYGESSSICNIPIGAAAGLLLNGLAALLGFSSNKGAQTAAKVFHDVANGALASWAAETGAELGLQKRMEKPAPAPAPQLNTSAEGPPKRAPRPMTYEELAEITGATGLKAKPAMPERPPAPARPHAPPPAPPRPHAPPPAPPPMPTQQKMTPLPRPEPVAAKVPAPTRVPQSATPPRSPLNGQPAPQEWVLDPEAEMRALLLSAGAPSDPKTVAYLLSHENPIDAYRAVVRRARAPA